MLLPEQSEDIFVLSWLELLLRDVFAHVILCGWRVIKSNKSDAQCGYGTDKTGDPKENFHESLAQLV
jgi:hypothetical protein